MSSDKKIPSTPSSDAYRGHAERGPIEDTSDPLELFATWFAEARKTELNDSNAMALATVDGSGLPDVRMVLLKEYGAGGFTFYTHETSTKGDQILANPKAALGFHWKSQRRQVRVRGDVVAGSEATADAYFASRARVSRLGAWASAQSEPLDNPGALKAKLAEITARFGEDGPVPRPDGWRGFCILPQEIEFWQDQPFRLHDRVLYTSAEEGWTRGRLNP